MLSLLSRRSHQLTFTILCLIIVVASSWNLNKDSFHSVKTRRLILKHVIQPILLSSIFFSIPNAFQTSLSILPAFAAEVSSKASAAPFDFSDLNRLKKGSNELNYLLSHWNEKTLYCNFGEFQSDLLTPDNKEKLLVAAAEFGLLDYDKSKTMNVVCKRDPEMVRAFLGVTPNNLNLNGAEKLLRKPSTVDRVSDVDIVERYFELVDNFASAISSADVLAYSARSDYASTETSTRSVALQAGVANEGDAKESYLDKSRVSVQQAAQALEEIVKLLNL